MNKASNSQATPTCKKEILDALDNKIDSCIPVQVLKQFSRHDAVILLLISLEDYQRIYVPQMVEKDGIGLEEGLKQVQDASHFAMKWIYEHCKENSAYRERAYKAQSHIELFSVVQTAIEYSKAWDFMSMARREWLTLKELSDSQIILKYANEELSRYEAADHILGAPDVPDKREIAKHFFQPNQIEKLISEGQPRENIKGSVSYNFPKHSYKDLHDLLAASKNHLWELNEQWDVGGYTVEDFRKFWNCLCALTMMHSLICLNSGSRGGAANSVVMIKHKWEWTAQLQELTSLSSEKIELIMHDLTYDSTVQSKAGKKNADVTYQPIFPIDKTRLGISNFLVAMSNAERNLWDLLSITRPTIHSSLSTLKEEFWLLELERLFFDLDFLTRKNLKVVLGEERTDLDLLVLDTRLRQGLVIQMKWRVAPDSIKDNTYTVNEFHDGMRQADLSLRWLNDNQQTLTSKLNLPANQLEGYEFKGLVLSKNNLGRTHKDFAEIPILNDRLLRWSMEKQNKTTLFELWQLILEFKFAPEARIHYEEGDIEFSLGGVAFVGEKLGMVQTNNWSPSRISEELAKLRA